MACATSPDTVQVVHTLHMRISTRRSHPQQRAHNLSRIPKSAKHNDSVSANNHSSPGVDWRPANG
eukprot:153886-Prorocentrum_minimum.AAC.1